MRKLVMQTAEIASTRETTERLIKIIDSTYAKEDLKQLAHNATQINYAERTQLFRLI